MNLYLLANALSGVSWSTNATDPHWLLVTSGQAITACGGRSGSWENAAAVFGELRVPSPSSPAGLKEIKGK